MVEIDTPKIDESCFKVIFDPAIKAIQLVRDKGTTTLGLNKIYNLHISSRSNLANF